MVHKKLTLGLLALALATPLAQADSPSPDTAKATVAVTAAVVGSVPPNCTAVNYGGMVYQQCGSTWYQPQYVGSQVQYIVVAPIY